ncbi:ABC transporter ATP-binding protein [Pseudoclavibacter sp. RFBJ3]|nr:ABC transporter ATP-binding protein [Pseudoclavibacter sp. RFBJ5]PPF91752.1 ABC transporter ATP-binding protein [Pseudoclavibacter sp. RFBJ3]PPF96689.1 ABC transporter ATP-binding protein [Pseudoclavibacter sp. RFBH5]PPG19612.1 ABC transporter ATP-binding protein [Pseudoclavibacter sp. RFBI4]
MPHTSDMGAEFSKLGKNSKVALTRGVSRLSSRTSEARRPHQAGGHRVAAAQTTGPRRLIVQTAMSVKRWLAPATALFVSHQLCEVAVPVVVGLVIDRGIVDRDVPQLAVWVAVLVAVFVLLAWSYRTGVYFLVNGIQRAHHELRMRVSERSLDPRGFGDRQRPTGELLGVGGSDVQRVAFGGLLFVHPVAELAAVIAAGVVLISIAWPLGVAVIVGGPLFLLLLDRFGRHLRARAEDQQRLTADSASLAANAIAGFRTLTALGATGRAARSYAEASQRARVAAIATRRAEAWFVGVSSTATGIFVVAIGLIAAALAAQGSITVGQLITVVGVVQVVMGPMEALAVNVGAVWARAGASAKRVLSLLQAPYAREPREGDGPAVDPSAETSGGASARERPTAARPVRVGLTPALAVSGLTGAHLREVSFTVERGEIIGVVADAHDAAELVGLLGGRIHPPLGTITVDGLPLAEVDAERLHELVTAAPHAAHTVPGTVAANVVGVTGVAGARRSPDDALAAAAFEDVLEQLPNGIRTPLGGAGRTLSGGQRQRLALARALAAPAPVLVLHEPTGSIDAVTEQHIGERMRTATAQRATVVVCSNPQLLVRADRVLVLRDGSIAAEGTHDELMSTDPRYAEAVA